MDENIKVMLEARVLLQTLNGRIEDLNRHQFYFDFVGVGLTVLGVVLAIIALLFMWNVSRSAKKDAKEAAERLLQTYLSDKEKMSSLIEPWLDNHRTEIAGDMYLASLAMAASSRGSDFDSAWEPSDLADIPDDEIVEGSR